LVQIWYKQNVSSPKSLERWDALITEFVRHLIARYGIEAVAQWYLEPFNRSHFAETGDEPVIVQITGVGPSSTQYVDPASDPRDSGKP
jgi:beta-xylosidase